MPDPTRPDPETFGFGSGFYMGRVPDWPLYYVRTYVAWLESYIDPTFCGAATYVHHAQSYTVMVLTNFTTFTCKKKENKTFI